MIQKMTNKEYHSAEGLSKSMMDKLKKSPAHLKYSMEKPEEQTEAMVLGSLMHTLLLEPKLFGKEYAVLPKIDRRTNQGKLEYGYFCQANEGKTIITQEQLDQVKIWANKIKHHPIAGKYFKKNLNTQNEVSIFWRDNFTQELCKARLDRIVDDVVIDLKTAMSAHPDDFQRKAYELGYHRQAYWFSEGYENEFGHRPQKFLFIVVEKMEPYNVVVYEADEFFIEVGGVECRKLLQTYHYCKETNNWFGYNGENAEIQMLSLPNYVIAKNMEEI